MRLHAWRNTTRGSTDHPNVTISIAPVESCRMGLVPWVLPLEAARHIFGPIVEEKIREEPVEVVLSISFPVPEVKT